MNSSTISTTNAPAAQTAYGLPDIALIGRAGAGKTTAAQKLVDLGVVLPDGQGVRYERRSFAAPLREVAVSLWGEDARNDRHLLQGLGVAAREIRADTWLDLFLGNLAAERPPYRGAVVPPVVVDDCRFENEFFALKALGFVTVRIVADPSTRVARLQASGKFQSIEQLEHVSETALDNVEADYHIVNDGTPVDLYGELVERVILREVRR